MKRILTLLLSAAVLFGAFGSMLSVSAKEPSTFGDLDANVSVQAADALLCLQFSVGKITLSEAQQKFSDVNVNGTVEASDALLILQYAVGKIEKLPTDDFVKYDKLLIEKPSSLLDNGSYSRDVTADTSFRISTEGLAEKTIYYVTPSAYNFSNRNVLKDAARFVFSLQGLINRDYGITHTSLMFVCADSVTDGYWYKYITGEGKQFEGYNVVEIRNFETFLSTFANQIKDCGVIMWDPDVPATANVAATICGLDGYLPVKYSTDPRDFCERLNVFKENGVVDFNIKQSLLGMFDGKGTIIDTDIQSTGSAKCDAYLWACDKYMARCSTKYMAYVVDGAVSVYGNKLSEYGDAGTPYSTCLLNHDYYIARRCFFFDLTVFAGEAPCDDPNQPIGTDSQTYCKLLKARYDRAGGEFGQMLGFPPWWLKYTQHNNLASVFDVYLEWMTVEFNTIYNMSKEADAAHPCSLANCSVYYKYVSTTEKFVNNEPTEKITYDPDTYYYLFYLGDYDSSAWMAKHIASFWGTDDKRGALPSAWAFNPNLSDRVPMIFDYLYSTATPNDYFMTGDSGAGYVLPAALTEGHEINTRCDTQVTRTEKSGVKKYTNYAQKYYNVFDMDITGFILNVGYPFTSEILDCYNTLSPVGSLISADRTQPAFMYNGVPYVYLFNCIGFDDSQDDIASIQTYGNMVRDMDGCKFSTFRTICKSPTQMYNLITYFEAFAERKGAKVKLCDPYNFFRLMKESGTVPEWDANYGG